MRRNTFLRVRQEAARQADLRAQTTLGNANPGVDENAGHTAGYSDPTTGEPARFGLMDFTKFGEPFRMS
jgi:hypothetical protein